MKKLNNPYRELSGYQCFGCAPENENGLRMEFHDDGDYIISRWQPRKCFEGYHDVLHGGIQSTLLDEIASWAVMTKLGTGGVTSRMEIRYIKPVKINRGPLLIRAKIEEHRHRIAVVEAEIMGEGDEAATKAHIEYYVFPEEVARRRFNFPGTEAFYTTE